MQSDNHIDHSLQDLLKGIADGNYPHLKVFMSRNNDDHKLPQDFLYVDPCSFGKVRVSDLKYCEDKICIVVQESTTGTIKEIIVDVNTRPDFLMVKWQDILEMVKSEGVSSMSNDQLLDFDY